MKKYIIFLLVLFVSLTSGCSIDYTSYFKSHPEVKPNEPSIDQEETPSPNQGGESNHSTPDQGTEVEPTNKLTSEIIEDGIKDYPSDSRNYIKNYDNVYLKVKEQYSIHSTYYSSKSDTIYIAYDNKTNPIQTLDSRDLAIIEEHLLFYFESDETKSEYNNYLKAIRIYPDFASSACRVNDVEQEYSNILGCASYNSLFAEINLNNLVNLDRFFNPHTYNDGIYNYYEEPRRDTFAHEYGHVSTYYHMILKGDASYQEYLEKRLKEDFNTIYPSGILKRYDSSLTYNIQPTEILADDYVELYYNTSLKDPRDKNDYTLEYKDLRNALFDALNNSSKDHQYHYQYLKDNMDIYQEIKDYYNTFINKKPINYDKPIGLKATTDSYFSTINDIINNKTSLINLDNKDIICLGEITINGRVYYRVILSNFFKGSKEDVIYDGLREHPNNIGYISKETTTTIAKQPTIIRFTKFNGEPIYPTSFIPSNEGSTNLLPFYDYSYYFADDLNLGLYDYLDPEYVPNEFSKHQFI